MGMDVYGLNPKKRVEKSQEFKNILSKYGEKTGMFLDWNKKIPKDVMHKYYDIKEQYEQDNPGIYFRNNVWWWRPLWDYVCIACSDIITKEEHREGHSNSGRRISKTKSKKIAARLRKLVKDGTVKEAEIVNAEMRGEAIRHNTKIDARLEQLRLDMIKMTGDKNIAPKDYPNKYRKQWANIYGESKGIADYPFSEENVIRFISFCDDSGGFEIC